MKRNSFYDIFCTGKYRQHGRFANGLFVGQNVDVRIKHSPNVVPRSGEIFSKFKLIRLISTESAVSFGAALECLSDLIIFDGVYCFGVCRALALTNFKFSFLYDSTFPALFATI